MLQLQPLSVLSQNKPNSKDSSSRKSFSAPAKAALFSALLPGAGQIINKRIWKVPVIYVGIGSFAYFLSSNQKSYKQFENALRFRYDDDANTIDAFTQYSDQNLITLKNQYRKRRDFSAAGIVLVYVLNIIDANVDAHLKQFDQKINENLSLSVRPEIQVISMKNPGSFVPGFKICLNVQSGRNR